MNAVVDFKGRIWIISEKILPLHEQKLIPVTKTPLVSFIITYHNEPETFLRACLESVHALGLTEDEAEIIVVDDGSENPCTMYNVLCTVFRQEQAGLSVARNTGISHAQGRYIQFVDADDCLIPSAYEAVIEQLRKEAADIILFRMTTASPQPSPKGREMSRSNSPLLWSGQGSLFLRHRNLRAAAWGYAFRREILGELRFCPGLLHEDELFTPQLFLKARSLCELDVKAYFYRQHIGTITHSVSPKQIQKRLNDIHFTIKELQSMNEPLFERRIRQLTVDYLQKTWTLTHSICEVRRRIRELRTEGVLPLPLCRYSMRYLFVASIANLI